MLGTRPALGRAVHQACSRPQRPALGALETVHPSHAVITLLGSTRTNLKHPHPHLSPPPPGRLPAPGGGAGAQELHQVAQHRQGGHLLYRWVGPGVLGVVGLRMMGSVGGTCCRTSSGRSTALGCSWSWRQRSGLVGGTGWSEHQSMVAARSAEAASVCRHGHGRG